MKVSDLGDGYKLVTWKAYSGRFVVKVEPPAGRPMATTVEKICEVPACAAEIKRQLMQEAA